MGVPILVEGFVVESACRALAEAGWQVTPVPSTHAPGVDITAVQGTERLLVEAKGAGSSREGSKRYGKPFNSGQVEISVGAAIYKALGVRKPDLAGVAFPDLPLYRSKVGGTRSENLGLLGISVFWVAEDGSVTIDGQT